MGLWIWIRDLFRKKKKTIAETIEKELKFNDNNNVHKNRDKDSSNNGMDLIFNNEVKPKH